MRSQRTKGKREKSGKREAEDTAKGHMWESIVKNMRKGEKVEKLKQTMMK